MRLTSIALAVLALLASCGGGGDQATPGQELPASPQVFPGHIHKQP